MTEKPEEDSKSLPEEGKAPIVPEVSMEQLLGEMVSLMQFAVESIDQPVSKNIPEDIDKRFSKLEKDVNKFASEANYFSREEMEFLEPLLPVSEKELIDRCQDLKKEMELKMEQMKKQDSEVKEEADLGNIESKEEQAEKRKKNFKRMSRSQQWKHL